MTWYDIVIEKLSSIYDTNSSYMQSSYGINSSYLKEIRDNTSSGFKFTGNVYHNLAGGNDNKSRFESSSLLVRDFTITGRTQNMNVGDTSNQSYILGNGSTWSGTKLDLSSLWFKNSSIGVGADGYLAILATRE